VTLTNKDSVYAEAPGLSDLAGGTATSQLGTVWYDVGLPQIENATILPAQESAPAMLVALNAMLLTMSSVTFLPPWLRLKPMKTWSFRFHGHGR
jgi:hypothetical protein